MKVSFLANKKKISWSLLYSEQGSVISATLGGAVIPNLFCTRSGNVNVYNAPISRRLAKAASVNRGPYDSEGEYIYPSSEKDFGLEKMGEEELSKSHSSRARFLWLKHAIASRLASVARSFIAIKKSLLLLSSSILFYFLLKCPSGARPPWLFIAG